MNRDLYVRQKAEETPADPEQRAEAAFEVWNWVYSEWAPNATRVRAAVENPEERRKLAWDSVRFFLHRCGVRTSISHTCTEEPYRDADSTRCPAGCLWDTDDSTFPWARFMALAEEKWGTDAKDTLGLDTEENYDG